MQQGVDQSWPANAGDELEKASLEADMEGRHTHALLLQPAAHDLGVADLGFRHLHHQAGALPVRLAARQVLVEVGAVQLVAPVRQQQLGLGSGPLNAVFSLVGHVTILGNRLGG